MSRILASVCALALFAVSSVHAEEGEACLQSGDGIGAFYVVKVAGAEGDGVEQGQKLCYRCRYGQRPMVMVFARDTEGKVGNLVKEIDSAVAANEDAKLKGLVTMLGKDESKLKESASKFASKTNAKNIPFVVATDHETGPSSYKINEDAAVTVVVASNSKVVASHSFKSADEVDVAAVMGEVKKALN
ncbi:hypothetical protein [Roseiconus lacunae]|uniref:Secreted protein n=1 Tax=Roseiconus lacunae TaxID=2605694 RepID=A0ABT7PNG9_9BACT|nr:hypothetical protein [Roseiconus lacunae]MCD0462633.1 hypothetical protein [Roseiconus lacunae]MDM4017873.1 hypothetical protein [Roseiconus lacunae]WRQ52552.1 hypothetical protein U8335_08385 [Stieleria sp. HD01]